MKINDYEFNDRDGKKTLVRLLDFSDETLNPQRVIELTLGELSVYVVEYENAFQGIGEFRRIHGDTIGRGFAKLIGSFA